MISIDYNYVDAAAPNASAIKNGRALVLKNKFVALHHSPDGTLLFGECQGSGASTYLASCDFLNRDSPVYRCSCPSRQFPCKHCMGLMYAWVERKTFSVAEVPEDVASKRQKAEQRAEKKKQAASKPRKVNKSALRKKIQAQLEGLDLLEKLTLDLVRTGMGNTNAKTARQIEQQARQLGNAYLPGAQAALHSYTNLFVDDGRQFDSDLPASSREHIYAEALDQLSRLHALVRQGRSYLTARLEDPGLKPDTSTPIAAWLGHAWQLRELSEAGLSENDVELVQLAFNSYDDQARREFVDTGVWMNLKSGRLQLTHNYRPYRAVRFIKEEDSFFQVAQIEKLFVYPGKLNPRIRWDAMSPRPIESKDLEAIRRSGAADFASLIKAVKGDLKSPLSEKKPIHALNYDKIGSVDGALVTQDKHGERLALSDTKVAGEPPTCHLLATLPERLLRQQTLIGRFHHNLDTHQLHVKPISIVSESAVVRLTF